MQIRASLYTLHCTQRCLYIIHTFNAVQTCSEYLADPAFALHVYVSAIIWVV